MAADGGNKPAAATRLVISTSGSVRLTLFALKGRDPGTLLHDGAIPRLGTIKQSGTPVGCDPARKFPRATRAS
jgi:hypothetical protein